MSKKGIIIAGGEFSENEPLHKYLNDESIVVCADSGYVSALQSGITPHVLIGDFDSLCESGFTVPEGELEVYKFEIEKDQSDTQLCVDYLVSKGITEIYLFGAIGGKRFDHTFANIQLLEYGLLKGAEIRIVAENTELFLVSGKTVTINGNPGDHVSVFALHSAENVTYTGLKYPLNGGTILSHTPYGMSNSLIENNATVSVGKGELLIIHTGGDYIEKR